MSKNKTLTYISEKKANKLFKKLNGLMSDLQKVIKEVDEKPKEPIEYQKSKPKDRDPDVAYDSKRAVVLNLSAVTKRTNREKNVIIQEGERLSNLMGNVQKSNEFVVKNIVGDVTKIVNELKSLSEADKDKIEDLEKIKKTFRYTVTEVANANKKIKQIEDKRAEMERKILDEKYFDELERIEQEYFEKQEELRKKFGVDSPETRVKFEKMEQELSEQEQEIQQNASEIEREAKEVIRSLRDVIKETYDIPSEIIEQVSIYLKTLGAVANIARKKDSAMLTAEGIEKFFADKEFRELLEGGGWARVVEQSDKVTIVGAKMPKLGTYFAELKLQGEQIINDLEADTEKKAKKKDIKTEGVFTDSINNFIGSLFGSAQKYINRLKEVFTNTFTQLKGDLETVQGELDNMKKENVANKKDLYKQYIDIQKAIKTFEISALDDLGKKV